MDNFKEKAITTYREKLKSIGFNDYETEIAVAGFITGFNVTSANGESEGIQGLALELIKL